MNSPLGMPSLPWRSLADMDRLYRSRLRWDEFLVVTKLMDLPCFEERIAQLEHPPINVADLLTKHPELLSQELDQAAAAATRLRLHIMHEMIHDAADGIWFAFAKSPPSLHHELIPPDVWKLLLIDSSNGVAWRAPSLRFEDLKCAYTRDLPDGHPVLLTLQAARDAAGLPPLVIQNPPVAPAAPAPEIHTGKPGRPSPRDLYLTEFARRIEEGRLEKSKAQQAKVLLDWFVATYPELKKPVVGTIENNIARPYSKARNANSSRHETK